MVTHGETINVLIPEGMINQIRNIMDREKRWISVQDFIRQAIAEKLQRDY